MLYHLTYMYLSLNHNADGQVVIQCQMDNGNAVDHS